MSQEFPPRTSAPDGRRLRWAQHRAGRREAFVLAGLGAVDRFGPNASAEQIADAAGVSRTVLYRYFRDREDLREAIAEHIVRAVLDDVIPQLQLSERSTPRQLIRATVDVIIGWLDEHPNLYHFLRARRTGASLDSVETSVADQVAELLKVLIMYFGLDADQAAPAAHGIVGFVEASGAWWISTRAISRAQYTDIVCRCVWNLLGGVARADGIPIGYDDPLPAVAALSSAGE